MILQNHMAILNTVYQRFNLTTEMTSRPPDVEF